MSRDPTAVAKRVTRALDEFFHAEATSNPDEYRVHSGSGDTYTVDVSDGTCTCPDGQRGAWCKHAYRVLFEDGELPSVVGTGVVAEETDDARPPE
ncbi:MAG TPA: SWIM zinc finger family protein, partial [Halococcus sp.]|nr:SWIM zinc finger family protein [Halococcus sp.]